MGNKTILQVVIIVFISSISLSPAIANEVQFSTTDLFEMSIEDLMNIKVISANKYEQKLSDIPASVVIITRAGIETYGYTTLEEILQAIPGLFPINDYNPEGINYGVRGFWSSVPNDNMIVLVNGVKQVNDVYSNYPMTQIAIPVEAIDRIEVIRGPMSVIYGSGAFFGVINIITDTTEKTSSQGIISAGVGSQKTFKLFTRVANQMDNFKYVSNAGYYDTKGIDADYAQMITDPAKLPAYDKQTNNNTEGILENSEKYFNFSGSMNQFSVDINYIESEREFCFGFLPVDNGSMNHHVTTNFSLEYNTDFQDELSLHGKVSYYHTRESLDFDNLHPDFYGKQDLKANAYELELNSLYRPSEYLTITSGITVRSVLNASNTFDLPSFANPILENNTYYVVQDHNITTTGLYTQATYQSLEKLQLIAGIRFQHMGAYDIIHEHIYIDDYDDSTGSQSYYTKNKGTYDEDDIEIVPRVAALYSLNKRSVVKLLYGQAINRPSFFQNRQNSLNPDIPNLKPEKIQTVELNYLWAITPKLTTGISVYKNELENLITRMVELDESGNYKTWSGNAGKMVTNGVEVTVTTNPINGLECELSGVYQESEDKRKGYDDIELAYSPSYLAYFKSAYIQNRYSIALSGQYVHEMETYWLIDEAHPSGHRIGDRTEPYLNIGGNLRVNNIFNKNIYLTIRGTNLVDQEIHYPTTTINPWADKGTMGKGRSFMAIVGLKF